MIWGFLTTLGSYSLQLTAGELTEWVFSPLRGICQPSCSVTTKKQKNDPLSYNNAPPLFFSFNSKIPPKPVGTEKSQNPQSSSGYVSAITLIFVRRSVPEGCFHSHKPAQGRYLSESPIKNIHTPKDKNDKSRLGKSCGRRRKGRVPSLVWEQRNIVSRSFLWIGQLWKFPSRSAPWTGGVQVPLITSSIPNTMFYSLTSMCSSMLFHPLLQILTLFCSIHVSYKLDWWLFSSLGFSSYPKILASLFTENTANITPRAIL